MTAGQSFVKMLRPFGAALFLIVFILFLIFAFSSGKDPVPGYEPPNTPEYYAQNMGVLKAELEENLFPHLDGITDCYMSGEKLVIAIEDKSYIASRAAILRYFDQALFEFIRTD